MRQAIDRQTIEEQLHRMEEEAVREMLHYYEKSKKQKLEELIKRAAGRYVPPKDLIFWPTALIANSLTEWGLDDRFLPDVKMYFDRWIEAGMPIYFVDDALAGVSLLDLYEKTEEEKYKKGADKLAEYLFGLERKEGDEKGLIPYRPSQKNGHIYADGIGMTCSFLIKYGVKFGNAHGVELGLRHMRSMLDFGMDEKTGLPYHGFRYADGVKYGIIGWGRAVGWIFIGMARSLVCLEGYLEDRNRLDSIIDKLEVGEGREKDKLGETGGIQEKEELEDAGGNREKEELEEEKGQEKEDWGMDGKQEFAECCKMAYEEIHKAFWQLFHVIEPYQKQNGSFGWQLEALEGPEDSSATAMIAYGAVMLLTGRQRRAGNWEEVYKAGEPGKPESARNPAEQAEKLEAARNMVEREEEAESARNPAERAEELKAARKLAERAAKYLASCEKDGKIYSCSAECKGFSEYPQSYGAFPWSLGPGLGVLRWYGMNFCEWEWG